VTKEVESDSSLGELDITCDNDKGLFNGILLNNGYEPVLTADNTRGTCNLTSIALDKKNFELHDLNVHFGCDTDRGSEHTVDGKPFPAEVRVKSTNYYSTSTFKRPTGYHGILAQLPYIITQTDDVSSFSRKRKI